MMPQSMVKSTVFSGRTNAALEFQKNQLHFVMYLMGEAITRRNLLRPLLISSCLLLLVSLTRWQQGAVKPDPATPVVLISIDGMKPDYVIEADKHGLKIPNLRRLVREGAYASGVRGVLPTVTYPSHTTMVTGVSPAKHGIVANTPFDPFSKNLGGWYWYAEDIKVPTLWDVASKAGMVTSSVNWPVTVGANITYNLVQYWRASTPDDQKLIRALSTDGLMSEVEQVLGPLPEGSDETVEGDRRRAPFDVYLIEKKKSRFHTCYFTGLDTTQHTHGPYSDEAFATIEKIDELVGQVRAAAERAGGGKGIVCVVSDHGFYRTEKELNLNAAFREAGLIQLDDKGKVQSWRAYAWNSGGSAAIMLQDARDEDARKTARELLGRLASDAGSGVARVLEKPEILALGGFPDATFVIAMKEGYKIGGNLEGPVIKAGTSGGTHGFLPENQAMESSFFLVGPRIPPGHNLGRIDMRDIAPTLAARLSLSLPLAEGHNVIP
jgi:predicted AlkP superfamily pyrophosphatase or phosphodiesterase